MDFRHPLRCQQQVPPGPGAIHVSMASQVNQVADHFERLSQARAQRRQPVSLPVGTSLGFARMSPHTGLDALPGSLPRGIAPGGDRFFAIR